MINFSLNLSKPAVAFASAISIFASFAFASEMTDPRDGHVYKTITIGNKVWMAENLNFKVNDSMCFEETKCDTYGRFYNWNDAKTVCPSGWHLPVKGEFDALLKIGPKALQNPNGFAFKQAGSFGGQDEFGYHADDTSLWGASFVDECGDDGEIGCIYAYTLRNSHFGISVSEEYFDATPYFPVRCVKD